MPTEVENAAKREEKVKRASPDVKTFFLQ